jgi:hypothetical protein
MRGRPAWLPWEDMSDSDALLPYIVAVVGIIAIMLSVLFGVQSAETLEEMLVGEAVAPGDRPPMDAREPRPARVAPDDARPAAPLREPDRTAIVWTSGGLPIDLPERLRALEEVEVATLVRGGLLELARSRAADDRLIDAPEDGFVIPLDAIAFNPDAYPAFFEGAEALEALQPGQALLSETSGAVRGIGAGGSLRFADGSLLEVVAVVPDGLIGGAEVAVSWATGRELGIHRERFMLTRHTGDLAALRERVQVEVVDDTAVRVEPTAGQPVIRHGMSLLTQAQIKERFGEFSYRRSDSGREIIQDPAWREENIVRRRVPILGTVRCHREIIDQVAGALGELEERGLADTVDRSGYAGCWNARLTNRLDALSRHSWGIAIDLNWPGNPVGGPSTQDPELIATFERWGMAWGGEWLLADPVHFEHVAWPR